MSLPRKTGLLFLLLLCVASGARPSASANAPQTAPPAPQAPAVTPPALPTEQETSPTAFATKAAKYPPGLLVTSVTKDSPLEQAGLKAGDLLLALDGVDLRFTSQITPIFDKARGDDKKAIALTVQREMQRMDLQVVVAPLPGCSARPPFSEAVTKLYVGASTLPVTQKSETRVGLTAAARAAAQTGDARAAAWLWNEVCKVVPDGSSEEAEATNNVLHSAVEAGDALLAAASLNNLGAVANDRGRLEEARNYHQNALTIREKFAPNSRDVAGSLDNLGVVASDRGQLEEAQNYFQRALTLQQKLAPNSLGVSQYLNRLGNTAFSRGQLEEAQSYYQRALAINEKLAPNSLDMANSLNNLGVVAYDRGQLEETQNYLQRALAIREQLAPNSLDVADSLNNLGSVARKRGRLEEAQSYYQRALTLQEQLAPNSRDVVISLDNLGHVAFSRGQLEEAQNYFQRAFALQEKLAPNSLGMAQSLNNLGAVVYNRGRLEEAQSYYQRALTLQEQLAHNSLHVAGSLHNLGGVALSRGQLEEAQNYLQRALLLEEKLAPNSLEVAANLNSLGAVAKERGELEEAQNYFQRGLTLQQKLAPNSLDVATSLNNLGIVIYRRGQLEEAQSYFQRGLTLQQKLAPNSLYVASGLYGLGCVALDRGQLEEAQSYYQRALAIQEKLAPASLNVAQSLHILGNVAKERGHLEEAERQYAQAWRIVQAQGRQVAGDSGRQAFGQANGVYAVSLLAAQLANSHAEAAFVTLEQGRAQALLQVMAERSLTEKVTPPAVWQSCQHALSAHDVAFKDAERGAAQLERARVLLRAQQEQKADAATLLDKQRLVAAAEQAFTAKRSEEIRTRADMENGWADVRRSAKAAIPEPLDAKTARTRLPQGTLVLEFAVGEKSIVLFAATSEGVNAYLLPATREELEAKVAFIRRSVAQDTEDRTAAPVNNRDVEADALRTLYGKLFPVEVQAAIRQAKHVVVSPDDFLWDLPFGALVTNADGAPAYLAQEKPLAYTQSLTLYLQPVASSDAANTRSAAGGKRRPGSDVLVIGNPLYDNARRADMLAAANKAKATAAATARPAAAASPKTAAATNVKMGVKVASARRDGELGTVTADGSAPPQLEHAQEEAEQVALLYHAAAHVGVEPTEAWFRQQVPQARIIHLATHGYLHPYAAQSSGVLLAVPAVPPPAGQYDNDGALQAWEVWSLHLNADLVVLSACETGRGAKVTGEGLIGLTRAWQYAGAKSVVSSLWKVSDASTAALMMAFHTHLLAGKDKDEALRLAMCETAASRQGAWASPHLWAAFVLVGDTGKLR